MPGIHESAEVSDIVSAYIDQHQLLPAKGVVIVGVSGGADSLCLLHLLHRLCGPGKRYPGVCLHAAHLDHRMRGQESARDAASVAAIAAAWGLPITTGEVDVPALARTERRSIEEAARIARYRFLRDVAREVIERNEQGMPGRQFGAVIAVAHHADDQVETLLLHWLRGSGLPGMVGMKPRQQGIIRPLLCVTHAQTVEYCRQQGITPMEDLSNVDLTYMRNRVRHQLLPLLESINPGFRAALLRNAGVVAVDLDFIESQVDAYWPQVVAGAASEQDDGIDRVSMVTLHIPPLLELPLSIQRHLLRRVAEQLCSGQSPLETRHYALIEDLLHLPADRQQRTLHLPQGLRLRRVLHTAIFETRATTRVPTEQNSAPSSNTSLIFETRATTRVPTPRPPHPRPYHDDGHSSPVDESKDESGVDVEREPLWSPSSQNKEARLAVQGEVMVPGTRWMARAELLAGDFMEKVKGALRREDWPAVWQLLPVSRSVVYVDAASAGEQLCVRTRRPGDRMQPLGMAHEKKVQDILVDAHVPRPERDSIPLFFTTAEARQGACLWLAGISLDERARLTSETDLVVKLSIFQV